MTRDQLLTSGTSLMRRFCLANKITEPALLIQDRDAFRFAHVTCAYYRPERIVICPPACAAPGFAGRAWSWPGYIVDRTPHGVVQHELGHHIDWTGGLGRGTFWSEYGENVRAASGEKKLTGYCPNDAEWFAEMFRLFVTNPNLLGAIRPKTHRLLRSKFETPAEALAWDEVLAGAPQRTLDMALRRTKEGS